MRGEKNINPPALPINSNYPKPTNITNTASPYRYTSVFHSFSVSPS